MDGRFGNAMTSVMQSGFEHLLPHRPPMLMLTRLLAQDVSNAHCTSVIDARNPLVHNGLFPATGGIELLAQAAGVLIRAHVSGSPTRQGVIVQIKSFRIEQVRIPVGTELHIHAHYVAGNTEAAIFEGRVVFGERCFFAGTLMVALLEGGFG
ncbi:MAG: hypothetical protein LJE91_05515 [Gammaproteobacteria bacterium]|jgi:predicted hotdog family 3-hydroxylacyl-ACP dehydratase|nr:hypothetical protein [Gammaproteobacteria bacterium]